MHLTLSTTTILWLLCTLLSLTSAQAGTDANGCSIFEPTSAYQISSSSPDLTTDLSLGSDVADPTTGSATNGSANSRRRLSSSSFPNSRYRPNKRIRRSANIPFLFAVSQNANNTAAQDLVVAFAGLPCGGPGPFSFEFNFQPQDEYFSKGQGQINMFRVNTQDLGDAPTWNSIEPLTGSLVGTFELPTTGSDKPVLLYLNQLVCQEEVVLRFGITRYSSEKGIVVYLNSGGMGLRERNGC